MEDTIRAVTDGTDLSHERAREAATAVFESATDAQIGALLAGLRAKGVTDAELAGFAEGMRDAARTIDPDRAPLVDTCGTGGDDHDTINVSTAAAIVAAGAGASVAKHGNYSVSSASGSADVLEALGVPIDAEPAEVEAAIERDGIGFLLAPTFHPAMGAVIGPRQELGVRTVFNVLGPLTNPAGADRQVVGVYDPDLVPRVARALARIDSIERALVVHGAGLDEIALHDATTAASVEEGAVESFEIEPADLGLEEAPISAVAGGSPAENAEVLREILAGEDRTPRRDIVIANAGAACHVGGVADSLREGVEAAAAAIDEGDALDRLEAMTGEPATVR